jgi:hypothetical protein
MAAVHVLFHLGIENTLVTTVQYRTTYVELRFHSMLKAIFRFAWFCFVFFGLRIWFLFTFNPISYHYQPHKAYLYDSTVAGWPSVP